MKAIIMAGGEGSRLRPLTCDRPKPLTPLLDRPVMEYIIKLLARHGFTEIGVTLQYLPEAIREYFRDGSDWGVSLSYFVEEMPLGTAGSVKNAGAFLDQTFVVISGDALTDFDLSKALEFHRSKGALATLVLTRVAKPLEYGVVITGEDGKITRFLEKPSWGEVFSDTVNTGIYFLEPEALKYFAEGEKYDFSQQLFPLLLRAGQPLYGCVLSGYWCDIGNQQQYVQAHYDLLEGRVGVELPGREVQPGIRVEEGAGINPEARLNPPVFLGAHTRVEAGVGLGPLTVVGANSRIESGASVKKSVLWRNITVSRGAQIRGAVLCNGVKLREGAAVFEDSIIGDGALLREHCQVKNGVKVWPGKEVAGGTVLNTSLIWGSRRSRACFGPDGYPGAVNCDLTPELGAQLGTAFAATLPPGAVVSLSSVDWIPAGMIHQSVAAGLMAGGAQVLDLGAAITPVSRYIAGKLGVAGGVHIKRRPGKVDGLRINFFDGLGANISKEQERKIENLLSREDFRRVEPSNILEVREFPGAEQEYLNFLYNTFPSQQALTLQQVLNLRQNGKKAGRPLHLIIKGLDAGLSCLVPGLLSHLGCMVEYLYIADNNSDQEGRASLDAALRHLSGAVRDRGADLGAVIGSDGEELHLVDEQGRIVTEERLAILLAVLLLQTTPAGRLAVPVTAPGIMETLAASHQAEIVRTKTARQAVMAQCLKNGLEGEGYQQFLLNFDALYALGSILSKLSGEEGKLSDLVEEIPAFNLVKKTVECPWEDKGRVIRHLIEDHREDRVELLDGVKVFYDHGWTLVLPDSEEPLCRIYSEGHTMEIAEELSAQLEEKIGSILQT
ncbi:MAG TPA: sugar phosphate nucleotidyltransferase [Bacillota bacterium]|nr:sugar phosphate nucleotidyltransferase [Bacillota bacterium]